MGSAGRSASQKTKGSRAVIQHRPDPLVLVERRGRVAILTLNNPPLNILTTPLLDELADQLLELSGDAAVRVLLITGGGEKGFSGGANINEMVAMDRTQASAFSAKGQAVANILERSPLPVIAAVHGFCVGGGCELVQACDFIVASEDAVFGQPEINIGVIPGWGGSRRLTRAVGVARARRWIMTGEKIPATTALAFGLLDRVVPKNRLMPESMALAQELATKPAVALAAAKYVVNQAADPGRLIGLDYERLLWGLLFDTDDQKEGMRAFLEKRPAVFSDQRDWTRRRPEFPWERPGNPLEIAKEKVYRPGKDLPGPAHSGSWAGSTDITMAAEAYREAGVRAFQALVALVRTTTESYRLWIEAAQRSSSLLTAARPRSKEGEIRTS
jgi:enoyl-CoA hydratase/carnithine racemase